MIHAIIRYEHEGEIRTYATPMKFKDRVEAQQYVRAMDTNYPHYTHTWEEVDIGVATAADAVTRLDAMDCGDDPGKAHTQAEKLLCEVLRLVGPEYASVAYAFNRARDRVGFWYA